MKNPSIALDDVPPALGIKTRNLIALYTPTSAPTNCYSVEGSVLEDTDGDGNGNIGQVYVRVRLFEVGPPGNLVEVASTFTDGTGNFEFPCVPPGV